MYTLFIANKELLKLKGMWTNLLVKNCRVTAVTMNIHNHDNKIA